MSHMFDGWTTESPPRRCERPDDCGYWFNVDTIRTVADLLDWCRHIAEKSWPERHDFFDALIQKRIAK